VSRRRRGGCERPPRFCFFADPLALGLTTVELGQLEIVLSALTLGAKMGRSPTELNPFNRCATNAAVVASSVVDPGLAAVLTVDALDVAKVAEGGAACANAVFENLNDRAMEFGKLGLADAVAGAGGENAAEEEGFVGVDIADASDEALVEQGVFDRATAFFEAIAQICQ